VSDAAEIRVEPATLGSLQELVRKAAVPLVWLLDTGAHPADDALPALVEHAPGPAASLPVDASGSPITSLMGRVDESDQEAILAAIRRRCMPLRHIQLTSLLVERDAVLELAPPDPQRFGWYAGVEWTARLFDRRGGVLVPASRVRLDGSPAGSPVHVLRAARSARWRRGEAVRELHRALTRRAG
jgi:hypothetical protein